MNVLNKFKELALQLPCGYAALVAYFGRKKTNLLLFSIGLFWISLALFMTQSDFGQRIEYAVARKLEFNLREKLGKSPKLNKDIKILAFSDDVVSYFNTVELTIQDWRLILGALSDAGVKQVFIDKMFTLYNATPKEVKEFNKLKGKPILIGAGAYASANKIPWKKELELKKTDINLDGLGWLRTKYEYAFGPHEDLRGSFDYIGHIIYGKYGWIKPAVRIKDSLLPHLSLYAGKGLEFKPSGISIDGKLVPLNEKGELQVNFPSRDTLYKNTKSLRKILLNARKEIPLQGFKSTDIVVILPLMYSGNSDMADTVIGVIPKGYVISTLINSVTTGQWLKPIPYKKLSILAAGLIGLLIGLVCNYLFFGILILLSVIIVIAVGLGGFVYFSFIFPWHSWLISLVGSAVGSYGLSTYVREVSAQKYRSSLAGLVPKDKLNDVLKLPAHLVNQPQERQVSLMFIDIVGFSIVAEQHSPKDVFYALKDILDRLTKIIHKHGGIVDKTLGDGLMCFFGYSYGEETLGENHADQALDCANEIQNENMIHAMNALGENDHIFPVRIGINTASVIIGDIGNKERIDFTLIGYGVNVAKMLESACKPFNIAFGKSTREKATIYTKNYEGVTRNDFFIKHYDQAVEAYELDPFYKYPEKKKIAEKVINRLSEVKRRSIRWHVNSEMNSQIIIRVELEDVVLVDFSETGLSFVSSKKHLQGSKIDINFETEDKELLSFLERVDLRSIECEVRWVSVNEDGGYLHGVQYLVKAIEDAQHLCSELKRILDPIHIES